MTKADVIAKMAEEAGITKKAAGEALDCIINEIQGNEKVYLPGLGTFKLVDDLNPDDPDKSSTIETVDQRRRLTALSFAVDLNRGVDVVNPDKVVYDAEKYLKWLEK
jgi:hypothetical protein